jgi:hypothetical protein
MTRSRTADVRLNSFLRNRERCASRDFIRFFVTRKRDPNHASTFLTASLLYVGSSLPHEYDPMFVSTDERRNEESAIC